jgi:type IV secretion system protein VirB6
MEPILLTAYNQIVGRLDNFITSTQTSITSSIHSTVIAAATLYFVLYGIAILRGLSEEPFMGIVIRGAKVAIVIALATQSSVYNEWVAQPLMHGIPDGLAQAVAGEKGGAQVFANMYSKVHAIAASVWDKSRGATEPIYAAIGGGILIVCGALYTGIGTALLIIVQIALSLLVALGPIFIGLFMFEPTRRWFSGWLGQAVNFLCLYLFILGIGALITNAILGIIPDYADFDFAQLSDLVLTCVVLMLFGAACILFLPSIATGIVGGASLNFLAGGSMIKRTAQTAGREAGRGLHGARLLAGDARRVAGSIRKRN